MPIKMTSPRLFIISYDLLAAILAWSAAFSLRYSFSALDIPWNVFFQTLPIVLVIQGLVMWQTGLYRGVWRFASLPDLGNIARAAVVGVLAIALVLFLFNRSYGIPRFTLALYPLFLILALGSPRLLYRLWKDRIVGISASDATRVLVLGAGRAGEMLVRDLCRDRNLRPVGFLDDNKRLKGAKVQGVPVLGAMTQLSDLVVQLDVQLIIIAMPSVGVADMRRMVSLCEEVDVPFRMLPRIEDLGSGTFALGELREVSIDDLLGRDPVALDWQGISQDLAAKVVLVSGGGGSIGSELCRQLARIGPSTLVIVDQSEFNLYSIEMELSQAFPALDVQPRLIDVCDAVAVDHVFKQLKPDVVFHAAAYKHVPMLETQAREAVKNNVVGTKTLASAADKHRCGSFVLVSTDKAVNPANVMGATKRVAEIFCQTLNRYSNTKYVTVRFGNVLGSAGSVVPLFKDQIKKGGPITVTHPDITRYFMTIPEASQLIMQSEVLGQGGEIFVLDMGEPIKISYLAEEMIRLSGKVPGKDIEIIYTGLRKGEKLYEELFHEQECLVGTDHQKIFLANSRAVDRDIVHSVIADMAMACEIYDNETLVLLLKKLVPEMGDNGIDNNNIIPFERVIA